MTGTRIFRVAWSEAHFHVGPIVYHPIMSLLCLLHLTVWCFVIYFLFIWFLLVVCFFLLSVENEFCNKLKRTVCICCFFLSYPSICNRLNHWSQILLKERKKLFHTGTAESTGSGRKTSPLLFSLFFSHNNPFICADGRMPTASIPLSSDLSGVWLLQLVRIWKRAQVTSVFV